MPTQKITAARFGPFEADFASGELRKYGLKLKLSGQPISILEMLVEVPGQLVTRKEIHDRLWAGGAFGDFDHGVNAAINRLREALGDSADSPTYIETVPRRGYRFIGTLASPAPEVAALVPQSPLAPASQPPPPHVAPSIPPPPAEALTGMKRPGRKAMLIAAVAMLGFAIAAFFWWRANAVVALKVTANSQVTNAPGLSIYPAISPDGERIAYSADRGHGFEIVVRDLDGSGREIQLTADGQQNIQPAWSPDGQWIAYFSYLRGGIWIVNQLGGAPRKLISPGARPAWSPDGQWIAYQTSENFDLGGESMTVFPPSVLMKVHPDGSGAQAITRPGAPEGGHGLPAWSPDSRHIVFVSVGYGYGELWTVSTKDGQLTKLLDAECGYFDPVYTPDGSSILVGSYSADSANSILQLPVSRISSAAKGKPLSLITSTSKMKHLSLSRDGSRLLYVAETIDNNLSGIKLDAHGKASAPQPLRANVGGRTMLPIFSPDGKHIAFIAGRTGFSGQLWTMDPDGSNAEEFKLSSATQPMWLPDSKRLMYYDVESRMKALWTVDIRTRQTLTVATMQRDPGRLALSPDGNTLLFQHSDAGVMNLWVRDMTAGSERQLTHDPRYLAFGTWSRDGNMIAAENLVGNKIQAVVVAKDGQLLSQMTHDDGLHFVGDWFPDNDRIAYAAEHRGVWNLYQVSRARQIEEPLTQYRQSNAYVRYPSVSPSGDQVVYEFSETDGNIWMLNLAKTNP
jgi:Tol biopolymer transport system component/DNA-binding winged helix-turn-helix (wHTH) protein